MWDLGKVLDASFEEVVTAATARLNGRIEFAADGDRLRTTVASCLAALARSLGPEPRALGDQVLSIGRADSDPGRGYRRAQLLLEAISVEVVAQLHRHLSAGSCRTAVRRVRALLGPAQVGLAAVVADVPPTTVAVR